MASNGDASARKARLRQIAHWVPGLVVLIISGGCSAATLQGVAAGLAGASSGYARASGSRLMVFGGEQHQVYLGCLSCPEYDSDSVFNEYGAGNPYRGTSITNRYGEFGSRYSSYSACNPYASEPPVIVDANGRFYGRLTVNRYHPQRIRSSEVLAWLAGVCQR